jgi:hypothetical protein
MRRDVATLPPRLREKVRADSQDGCWEWVAGRNDQGYGSVRWDGKTHRAHRLVYELLVGPVPDGLMCDHLCRVRHCVNPAHIELVTNRENILRGESWTARNARKTHCPKCHQPYAHVNRARAQQRICNPCRYARDAERYATDPVARERRRTYNRERSRALRAAIRQRGEGAV